MKNILVVKLSAIGDVIHALPVSKAIKDTFPQAHLGWVVEPPAYDILAGNPYIDEIIIFEKKKFKTKAGFCQNIGTFRRRLRETKWDAVLDLQGLFKSAVIAFLCGAKVRLGTCNMREGSWLVSKPVRGAQAGGHIVERYLDVARALGCQVGKVVFPLADIAADRDAAQNIMKQAGLDTAKRYVLFMVGANWPNKRWPIRHYAALADWLCDRQMIPVVAGGGAIDEDMASGIAAAAKNVLINIVGQTTLPQLAAVIRRASLVLGGDTGPVHLAAGLQRPVVMVMGPTDANRNGPYGQTENAIEAERICRYCWKRVCPQGLDCLACITPEMVEEKISALLGC